MAVLEFARSWLLPRCEPRNTNDPDRQWHSVYEGLGLRQ